MRSRPYRSLPRESTALTGFIATQHHQKGCHGLPPDSPPCGACARRRVALGWQPLTTTTPSSGRRAPMGLPASLRWPISPRGPLARLPSTRGVGRPQAVDAPGFAPTDGLEAVARPQRHALHQAIDHRQQHVQILAALGRGHQVAVAQQPVHAGPPDAQVLGDGCGAHPFRPQAAHQGGINAWLWRCPPSAAPCAGWSRTLQRRPAYREMPCPPPYWYPQAAQWPEGSPPWP